MKPAFAVFLKANCPTQLKPVSSDRTVLSFSLPNAAPSLDQRLDRSTGRQVAYLLLL